MNVGEPDVAGVAPHLRNIREYPKFSENAYQAVGCAHSTHDVEDNITSIRKGAQH